MAVSPAGAVSLRDESVQSRTSRKLRSHWPAIIAVVIGAALSGWAFWNGLQAEHRRIDGVFSLRVEWRFKDIEQKIAGSADAARATAVFAAAQTVVNPAQFRVVAEQAYGLGSPVRTLIWAPRVTQDQRLAFETEARAIAGMGGFAISRRRPDSALEAAPVAGEYFPAFAHALFENQQSFIGLDVLDGPARQAAAAAARDTGAPVATGLVPTFSGDPTARIYSVFYPVYAVGSTPATVAARRAALRGYVVANFQFARVLQAAIADTPDIVESIRFLVDDAAPGAPVAVAAYSPAARDIRPELSADDRAEQSAYQFTRQFDALGRRWTMESTFPIAAVREARTGEPLGRAISGLLVTALVGGYLFRARRRASSVLDAEAEKFRYLFASNPHPMWVFDRETLQFLEVNAAAVDKYGYSHDEFLAMKATDIRSTVDAERLTAWLGEKKDANGYMGVWKHKLRDGAEIDAEIHTQNIEYAGRAATLLVSQDVTARRKAEDEIRSLNAELEERVKTRTQELTVVNRELEAFSYSVSHDLRAPLRAIDGFSRMLLEEHAKSLDEDGRHFLNVVRKNSQQMGRLIDDLLAFSRLGRQALKTEPVSLDALVRQTLDELHADINGRKIDFVLGDLGMAPADQALLKQVWVNLLSNAIKFTRNASAARIEVGRDVSPQGDAVFHVRDNGAGFDMKYSDKLFNVFQRLHRVDEFEGTGVGLAIVQRVVGRHGGRVWADARPGEGAAFYFTLQGA